MNSPMTMNCFAGVIAILVMCSCLRAEGTVQISSVYLSPVDVSDRAPNCRWVTVRIAVEKEQSGEDPTVVLSFAKFASFPPEISVEITPPWISATLAGSSAFHIRVCSSYKMPGRFEVEAAILGVGPREKFKILPPDPPARAEINTPIP